jgi:hypothetical protein
VPCGVSPKRSPVNAHRRPDWVLNPPLGKTLRRIGIPTRRSSVRWRDCLTVLRRREVCWLAFHRNSTARHPWRGLVKTVVHVAKSVRPGLAGYFQL